MALVHSTAVVLAVATSLFAQEVPETGFLFATPDRAVLRMLDSSRQLLDQGSHYEAIRLLSTILEAKEDFFVAAGQSAGPNAGRQYRSLKSEARKILETMPSDAQKAYELLFGSLARKLLKDAVAAGDIEQISEVQRRYFQTAAGHEAMYLLGSHYLDHGRFLTAAQCFQSLRASKAEEDYEPALSLQLAACWLWAGEPAQAKDALVALQKRFPNAQWKVGGRSVELFRRRDEALGWLRKLAGEPRALDRSRSVNWPMFRNDPARQGRGNGGLAPFTQPVWRQAVSEDIEAEMTLQAQRAEFFKNSTVAFPAVMPLAINNLIVMRTPHRLAAVDFQTGKRIWQADQPDQPSGPATPPQTAESRSSASATLKQRLWLDTTYGSLSSDGNAVFVIEGFGLRLGPDAERTPLAQFRRIGQSQSDAARPHNVLSAYELRSQGKQIWSSSALDDDAAPPERLLFLGPPLPLEEQLYSIVEIRDAIHLVVLGPSDGKLRWSQPLALVPQGPYDSVLRRTGGISPSFANGILICPTGVGAVVAVNLTTRSLLWAYEFPVAPPAGGKLDASDTWADSCAVISGRRVLITPAECRQMHCLDLIDGSLQWCIDRGDLAFLACVDRDVAVVVGARQITGIDLKTGKVAAGWPLKLPQGSLPSGRGYHANGHYYLPLNVSGAGEVAAIQLDPPTIVHRSQWLSGEIPGNLICHRGQVLSQNVDWLESFRQVEPLGQDSSGQEGSRSRASQRGGWVAWRKEPQGAGESGGGPAAVSPATPIDSCDSPDCGCGDGPRQISERGLAEQLRRITPAMLQRTYSMKHSS